MSYRIADKITTQLTPNTLVSISGSIIDIIDLTKISQCFPRLPKNLINRPNYLNTIDDLFENGIDVVLLEAADGYGKSTLAAQYSMKHSANSINMFINLTSRWSHDPLYIQRDMCSQINWILYGKDLDSDEIDDSVTRALIFNLHKKAIIKYYYFIVDGLDQFTQDNAQQVQPILNLLPIGHSGFKFLISSNLDIKLPLHKSIENNTKSYPMSAFIRSETAEYFKAYNLADTVIDEIHSCSKGIPDNLFSIKRILEAGEKPETLLSNMPEKLPSLFEYEWKKVDIENQQYRLLILLLAYDYSKYTVMDISQILKIKAEVIVDCIKKLSFLSLDTTTQDVTFATESYRRFAAAKLKSYRKEIEDILIDNYLQDKDSPTSISKLPTMLKNTGRLNELLEYLSPDTYSKALTKLQSLEPLRQATDLCISTAYEEHRDSDLMKYVMNKTVLEELHTAAIWQIEVEAKIAMGDYSGALATAQSAPLKEDRLQLLAIIAKSVKQKGEDVDPTLTEQIHALFKQINKTTLGKRAISLACDLIFTSPNLAIELIDSQETGKTGINTDIALATLWLKLNENSQSELEKDNQSLLTIRDKIANPDIKQFSQAAAITFKKYTASTLIDEINGIKDIRFKVFFLRQWALQNKQNTEAADVIEYALQAMIQATEYTPNSRDVRQICSPLPYLKMLERALSIISKLDGLKASFQKYGPTVDYVRLQLLLAETELKCNIKNAAKDRVVELYYEIFSFIDKQVRAECMAYMLSFLTSKDPNKEFEQREGLHSLVEKDLMGDVNYLLDNTAIHHVVVKEIIRALAISNTCLAINIALLLNTEPRRDKALCELIKINSRSHLDKFHINTLKDIFDKIQDNNMQNESLIALLKNISESPDVYKDNYEYIAPLLSEIENISDVEDRCRACCYVHIILKNCSKDVVDINNILQKSWNSMASAWGKIHVAYLIAATLSDTSRDVAQQYLNYAESLKQETQISAPEVAWTIIACLRLAISSLAGLIKRRLESSLDIKRLETSIDIIPSDGEKAMLWGDLALRYVIAGRTEDAKSMVNTKIRPLLNKITLCDLSYKNTIFVQLSPLLYIVNDITTLEEIVSLSMNQKNEALSQICLFILHKDPLFEPYETTQEYGISISYDDMVIICELLKTMDWDWQIYNMVYNLTCAIHDDKKKIKYTQEQRDDIIRRLEELANQKFPNAHFIKHEGYKYATLIQIGRIKQAKTSYWTELERRIKTITNTADRVFLLIALINALPSRDIDMAHKLILEVKEEIKKIPTVYDRVERQNMLARNIVSLDLKSSRLILKHAMNESLSNDDDRMNNLQQSLVNFAHRIDPEFAASLVSMLDKDPARVLQKTRLNKNIKLLDFRKSVNADKDDSDVNGYDDLPNKAWKSLAALNAGQATVVDMKVLRKYVSYAAKMPLSDAYPIIAWVFANIRLKYSDTDQAERLIRPFFEATLLTCQVSERMACRSACHSQTKAISILNEGRGILIHPGESEIVINHIKQWISQSVEEYLIICDPYFGPEDLYILKWILENKPTIHVYILTSLQNYLQNHQRSRQTIEDAYRTSWALQATADPPDTEIYVVGTKNNGEFPIHDRWWITKKSGLRMGTSINSIGESKVSEISLLSAIDAESKYQELHNYLLRTIKEHKGNKVLYNVFNL